MEFCRKKVIPFDPSKIKTVDDLCRALVHGGFQGRKIGAVVDLWETMCHDADCMKVMTLAGAMVPAGMGELLMQLIEARAVDVIISTGANVTHDFVNAVIGQAHYLGSEHEDDDQLRAQRINRVFDVYIPEIHYESAEAYLLDQLRREEVQDHSFSTAEFTRFLGERVEKRCLLSVAAKCDVPVFVPAIADSELGLCIAVYRKRDGLKISFDEIGDAERFGQLVEASPLCGCVVIGGGVPRNWAQQVFPYLDVVHRVKLMDCKFPGFSYGVRISTDRPDYGGLSGCTFEESKSWGKYRSNARFESVVCDATIALPIVATALLERLKRVS